MNFDWEKQWVVLVSFHGKGVIPPFQTVFVLLLSVRALRAYRLSILEACHGTLYTVGTL